MQTLEAGVPMTIANILESHNWRRRKDLVNKVFTPDAVFWHPFFIVHGRHEILGIYQVRDKCVCTAMQVAYRLAATCALRGYSLVDAAQLWGANNVKINVTYDRVVPDAEHNVVVVDLLETVVSSRT